MLPFFGFVLPTFAPQLRVPFCDQYGHFCPEGFDVGDDTVAISDCFGDEKSLDRAMQTADAALYRGKKAGRNRVEWALPATDSLLANGRPKTDAEAALS